MAQSKDNVMFETGQFKKVKQSDLADITRVITESEIRLRGANNLKDILLMETGGIFNYDAIKGWQFQWHGSTKGNILFLIDGLPFRSVQFDEMDLQQIPLDNISRIEITENPQGVAYGSSAIMGVINIISKVTQAKVYKPSFRFQGYNPGSSYVNANIGRRTTENFFRLNSSVDAFAGRQGNDSGRVLQWLPYTRVTNQLFFSHKILQYMDVSFGFNNLYESKTQLGYPYPQTVRAYDRETKTNNNSFYAGIKGKLTQYYNLQGDLQLMDYKRNNTLFLKDILTAEQKAVNDTSLNDTIHYSLVYSRWVLSQSDKNKDFDYQAGFDIASTQDRYKPTVNNVRQVNTTTSLFLNLRYSGLKNILFYGGFRLPNSAKYNTKALWDAKLNYKFTPAVSFKLMVARSTKAPTFDQMFATYLTNGYSIKRNLNLTDESVMSYHYSLLIRKENLTAEAGFFNYFFKDGIELVADKNTSGRLVHKNISKKKTLGTRINIAYQSYFMDLNLRGVLTGNNYFANLFDEQLYYNELYSNIAIKIPRYGLSFCYTGKLTSERGYMILDAAKGTQTFFNEKFYLADAIVEKSFGKKTLIIRGGIKNIANIKNLSSSFRPDINSSNPQPQPFLTPLIGGRNYFIELNINI
ncbi:MAG: TonB-dependent receptor plug domain-containing protein [Bacteroidia bacterium]